MPAAPLCRTTGMNVSPASPVMNSLFTSAAQGIHRAMAKANEAGEQVADGELDPESFIELNESELLMKANVATMRTGDEMLGTLLNVKR